MCEHQVRADDFLCRVNIKKSMVALSTLENVHKLHSRAAIRKQTLMLGQKMSLRKL